MHLFIKCFGAIETSEEDAFFGFHHICTLLKNGLERNAQKELGLWFGVGERSKKSQSIPRGV
jgi:hypothetical protein